jgi:poly(A) polymerase
MTEREFATEVVSKLQRAGYQALFAGGCVRDELLGLTPADYDVATSARPEEVQANFRRTHSFGASFGVVEVLGPKDANGEWLKVQVATFRSDGNYSDGRRPDSVTFSSPEEDAARRDFTINGLFRDPISGKLWDFVGGEADLNAKVLRAIGHPEERFTEDKLRILRAVRMAARFELSIDPATLTAAKRMASEIKAVSAERIAEELRKILTNRHRERGVRLLAEVGLVEHILPTVNRDPAEWERTCAALGRLPLHASFELAFTLLFRKAGPGGIGNISRQLRLSNDEWNRVSWLWMHNERTFSRDEPRSTLYPLLAHPAIHELLTLHRAEETDPDVLDYLEGVLRDHPPETFNPPRLLTGDDLKEMGLPPGPLFKRLLEEVRVLQLDGQLKNRWEAEEKIRERLRESQQG